MNLHKVVALFALVGLSAAFAAHAQSNSAKEHSMHNTRMAAPASAAKTDGEVRRIDKDQGKVTLRHGAIANLDMPGMTMVFKVADAKMLDGLKEGDKVKFAADKVNGAITVTSIEAAK